MGQPVRENAQGPMALTIQVCMGRYDRGAVGLVRSDTLNYESGIPRLAPGSSMVSDKGTGLIMLLMNKDLCGVACQVATVQILCVQPDVLVSLYPETSNYRD